MYNINMDKKLIFTNKYAVTHGRGYVYSLQYHIVWATKYRKPVLTGQIAEEVKQHILDTMATLQMDCLEMEVMPDHIHILTSCKPQLRLSDAIKVLKGTLPGGCSCPIQRSKIPYGEGICGTPLILS